jgi:hypothetical protein
VNTSSTEPNTHVTRLSIITVRHLQVLPVGKGDDWTPSVFLPRETRLKTKPEISTHLAYTWLLLFVYYETIKGELNRRLIYECRCDERLKTKPEEFTLLLYTGLRGGLEHLKIETRLII